MATKEQVIELNAKHPDWTSRQIAEAIPGECDPAYVRATAKRQGLTLGRKPVKPKAQRSKANGRIEIVLATSELIEFCHEEVLALLSKMAEHSNSKSTP